MTYGTVRFRLFGEAATATLTGTGWSVPAQPEMATAFDALADPADFGPAEGEATAGAVKKLAAIVGGSYELAELPGAPAGTIY